MAKNTKKLNLPGTIYRNKKRWWWKVQLPKEDKPKARPLKPVGAKFATTDRNVAIECAKDIWAKAIFDSDQVTGSHISNIAELAQAYLHYVKNYYTCSNGHEAEQIEYALRPVINYFASLPIDEFGPLKLKEVREYMIKNNLSRGVINHRIQKIKRMFKWAVSEQIISPFIYHGLGTVEGLKKGRCNAKEVPPVKPVDEKYIYAILPYTTPVIAAMIELQLLTGMRPGELVLIRPCDIDMTSEIWRYYPEKHKNQYRRIERIVSIGPRGQQILRPFLLRGQQEYCFSAIESEQYRRDKLTENRKTPLSCGNKVGTNRKEKPQRSPGKRYDSASYRKAVQKAIVAARRAIKQRGGDPDKEMPKWTPYQMRHTAATKVRKYMGYESAGAALGHTNMSATAIYAERNQDLADDAARKLG